MKPVSKRKMLCKWLKKLKPVKLTSVANASSSFIAWAGVICSETSGNGKNAAPDNTQATCTFTVTSDLTVNAQFDLTTCITTISGSRRDALSQVSVTAPTRSEEHTSELQSPLNLVC